MEKNMGDEVSIDQVIQIMEEASFGLTTVSSGHELSYARRLDKARDVVSDLIEGWKVVTGFGPDFKPDVCPECAKAWRSHVGRLCDFKNRTIRELFDILLTTLALEGVEGRIPPELQDRIDSALTYEPFIP